MEKEIVKLYKKGLSAYQIMDKLKITSKFIVYRVLKENNLTRDYINCRHPNANSNYFNKIDTHQKAYWLGFIFADGCIRKNRHGFTVSQHPKDLYILEKLRKTLGVTSKIQISKQPLATLYVNNVQLRKALIDKGCIPAKSLIIQPPKNVPKKYHYSFILGLFDGDGSIYIRHKPTKRFVFDICGATEELIQWCHDILNFKTSVTKHHSTYRTSTSDLSEITRLFPLLYNDVTICLKRKKVIFKQACAVYNRKVINNNRTKTVKNSKSQHRAK